MSIENPAPASRTVLCPRCQANHYLPYGVPREAHDPMPPAVSRRDNKTHICSGCGTEEALDDFRKGPARARFDRDRTP